jgi:hypothetical protein
LHICCDTLTAVQNVPQLSESENPFDRHRGSLPVLRKESTRRVPQTLEHVADVGGNRFIAFLRKKLAVFGLQLGDEAGDLHYLAEQETHVKTRAGLFEIYFAPAFISISLISGFNDFGTLPKPG